MDALKSNSEKQQQLLVFLKLVYDHERCENSQFHQHLSPFGMIWQIQVEVTLALIQGRLCYERLPRKKDCHASVINSCMDHNFFNRLIFGLYEINLQHALALRIMSDYSFFLFARNLFPKSFKFNFIDL